MKHGAGDMGVAGACRALGGEQRVPHLLIPGSSWEQGQLLSFRTPHVTSVGPRGDVPARQELVPSQRLGHESVR